MRPVNPWLTGGALALTVVVAYTVCALVFVSFPGASMRFMNALFHGLDFGKLQITPGSFSLFDFGIVVVIWGAAGFVVGVLYGGFYNVLSRDAVAGREPGRR